MKKVKFKDLRVGDFLYVPFLNAEIYIKKIDSENEEFVYSSLKWMPTAESTMSRILTENSEFFLIGVAKPRKMRWYNSIKRCFDLWYDEDHAVEKQEFSATETRIFEFL